MGKVRWARGRVRNGKDEGEEGVDKRKGKRGVKNGGELERESRKQGKQDGTRASRQEGRE